MLGADMKDFFYGLRYQSFLFLPGIQVKGKDAYPLLREKFKDPKFISNRITSAKVLKSTV